MKREFLESLGLPKEQIDQIMAQNGQDIESAKQEAAGERTRADGLQAQLDALTADLESARNEAGNYKDLQARLNAADARVKAYQRNDALATALAAYKPRDAKMLIKLLDQDKITFAEDGSIVSGLDEQVKSMKAASGYLFTDTPNDKGGSSHAGSGGGTFDMNAFLRGEQ